MQFGKTAVRLGQTNGGAAFLFASIFFITALAVAQEQSAKTTFNTTCASCHGQSGTPTAVGKSLNAPVLSSQEVQNHTDTELQQIISNGKGKMPAFKGSLSEVQIESLVAYIRTFSTQQKQGQH